MKKKFSITTIMVIGFFIFTFLPIISISIYSLNQYENAINFQLNERLKTQLNKTKNEIFGFSESFDFSMLLVSSDTKLRYFILNEQESQVINVARQWADQPGVSRIRIYKSNGRPICALDKNYKNESITLDNEELGGLILSPQKRESLSQLKNDNQGVVKKIIRSASISKNSVELTLLTNILTPQGRLVGFVEESRSLSIQWLGRALKDQQLQTILGLVNNPDSKVVEKMQLDKRILSSHSMVEQQGKSSLEHFFRQYKSLSGEMFVGTEPMGFRFDQVSWGNKSILIGVGYSKLPIIETVNNIGWALTVSIAVILTLLLGLFSVTTRIIINPIKKLVDGFKKLGSQKEVNLLGSNFVSEIEVLNSNFNQMSETINKYQFELEDKINELESTNIKLKQAQAQLVHTAKMAGLGQLVAGVAHELNNPISFIYANIDPLKSYTNDLLSQMQTSEMNFKDKKRFDFIKEDLPKLIKSFQEGAERTKNIVTGLRRFSRLDEAEIKEVNLADGIEATLKLLGTQLKGISVTTDFQSVPLVTCYPSQLNQVFMNILSNAIHATEGREKRQIGIFIDSIEKGFVRIQITDNGRGIQGDKIDKIFEPFYTTKQAGEGTGLGLSISYGIIKKHEGSIVVVSNPNIETKFTILIPSSGPKLSHSETK